MKKKGKIIVPSDVNIRPHERNTAWVLAQNGHDVCFIKTSNIQGIKTSDIILDNAEKWEMKSPRTANLKAIERNLKRGRRQAKNVILDAQRMKGVPDEAIEREIKLRAKTVKNLNHIKYINHRHKIIDIL